MKIVNLVLSAGAAMALAVIAAPTDASASYASKCKKLIQTWETCRETEADCTVEEATIERECKCHKRKGDSWKIVVAAVGDDGVCDADWGPHPRGKKKQEPDSGNGDHSGS